MARLLRVLALGIALVLALAVTAAPASAGGPAAEAAAPPLPDSIAAIGDSTTQAVDVCCFFGNWPSHSWSTGHAPLDGIASHYERIRAPNPAIRGHRWNNAVSGARMADAPAQARRTVDQGAQYVTILMGANDLCGRDGTLTPTASFRASFQQTLDILRAGLPDTRVFVSSIPNLHQLWSILRKNPVAQVVWQTAGICPSMLNFFNAPADRQAVIDRERELNRALDEVCATWSHCRFDNYLTYNYAFTWAMVSKLDWFHPSLAGQATLAALTWKASWWGHDEGRSERVIHILRGRVTSGDGRAYAPGMSESAANPLEPPPLTPEELAEIRAVLEQVRRGDYSGTIPWEEIAKEFDLPSSYGS